MILKRCYIENFGKLKDKTFEFKDGLNTIKEDNGWGKSTLAVFIKAMFFGMEFSQVRKELVERKKFLPWQGGDFGGNLEFEIDGKEYKIIRYFGTKKNDDTFVLYNLATNKITEEYTENIGEEVFGIDSESFERSVFITLDGKYPVMQDSINAKLNDLIDNTDDINNFEKAYATLEKISREIKPDKSIGNKKLGEVNSRITEIESLIEECVDTEKEIELLSDKIEKLNKEKEENDNGIKEIKVKTSDFTKYLKKQEYLDLLKNKEEKNKQIQEQILDQKEVILRKNYNEINKIHEEVNQLKEFFEDIIPNDEKINLCYDNIHKYKNAVERLNNSKPTDEEESSYIKLKEKYNQMDIKNINIDELMNDYNTVADLKYKIERENSNYNHNKQIRMLLDEKKQGLSNIIPFIIGIAAIIISIILFFTNSNLYASISLGIGIIFVIITIIFKIDQKKESLDTDVDDELEKTKTNIEKMIQEQKKLEDGYLEVINNVYPNKDKTNILKTLSDIKSEINKYNILEKTINTYKTITEDIKSELEVINSAKEELLGPIRIKSNIKDDEELILTIKNQKNKYVELTNIIKEYDYYTKNIDNLTKEYRSIIENIKVLTDKNDINEFVNIETPNKTFEELQEESSDLESIKEGIIKSLISYQKQLEEKSVIADKKVDFEEELERLIDEQKYLLNKYDILTKTMSYLNDAKENLSTRYLKPMTEAFNTYMSMLDGGEQKISIDVDLKSEIINNGKYIRNEHLSRGYKDIVNICTRIALIKAMYQEKSPFIILDDPFVNLDDDKLNNAINIVKELSKEHQILYLVCQSSRVAK
ncbi:MAG TPA: AAA family ATPase [Clostridiales bacterium]|nr:AAA family ATPase [Clostridiales bacterium]